MPSASDATPRTTPRSPSPARAAAASLILRPSAWPARRGSCCRFPSLAPNPYILSAGVVVLNYAVLATSWNFVGGFTGYISLGHAAYSGLGAYGTGLLVIHRPACPWLRRAAARRRWSSPSLAVPIGIAALRVRGASFVIVSIALVLILLLVFQSWASFTGGSNGLLVPRPFARAAAARAPRALLLPLRRPARGGAAGLVADRPLPLRHGAQGDPRGRGQGAVARRARPSPTSWSRSSSRRSSPRSAAASTRCGSATSTRSSSSRSWSAPTWC